MMFIIVVVLTIIYHSYVLSKLTIHVDDSCTVYTANFNYCTCLTIIPHQATIKEREHMILSTSLQLATLVLPLSPWHQFSSHYYVPSLSSMFSPSFS